MPMFRKKPVVIEAYRLPQAGEEPSDGLVFFLRDNGLDVDCADPGVWIIKGALGDIYYCSPEDFADTYEPIS